jgi:hypothetical protein
MFVVVGGLSFLIAQVDAADGLTAHELRLVIRGLLVIGVVIVVVIGAALKLVDRAKETPNDKAGRPESKAAQVRQRSPRAGPSDYVAVVKRDGFDTSTKVWFWIIGLLIVAIPVFWVMNG